MYYKFSKILFSGAFIGIIGNVLYNFKLNYKEPLCNKNVIKNYEESPYDIII